jgi:NhaP-type Na+/H+ or K+/H+ antiporter
VTGAVVAALLGCVLQFLTSDSKKWTAGDIAMIAVFSVLLGVPVGMIYREIFLDGMRR